MKLCLILVLAVKGQYCLFKAGQSPPITHSIWWKKNKKMNITDKGFSLLNMQRCYQTNRSGLGSIRCLCMRWGGVIFSYNNRKGHPIDIKTTIYKSKSNRIHINVSSNCSCRRVFCGISDDLLTVLAVIMNCLKGRFFFLFY